jgi:hypothetical protein
MILMRKAKSDKDNRIISGRGCSAIFNSRQLQVAIHLENIRITWVSWRNFVKR